MSLLASLQRITGGKLAFKNEGQPDQQPVQERIAVKSEINLIRFFFIMGQLALLAIIIRQFQIQSGAFLRIYLLAFLGFAIHYFLPIRYRLPFFTIISLASIGVVLGVGNALWLIAFGVALIGICQLPIKLSARILLLSCTFLLYMAMSVEYIKGPWSNAIWPLLGSMFIFRIVIFLYDTRHEKVPSTLSQKLSYFFMMPNVCFPLLPVVDYTEFRRTYYNEERHQIYQVGVDWMIRGIIHLILYRIVYQYITITPAEVVNPDTLVQFLVSNFLLYLRISGYFHLITGFLHLFGFNLLATHHRYCLASSFTDFWRRINIYWKDFMMKVFYYPIMFKLRVIGQGKAIVVATASVFLATWLLHSYLWFWLRGSFPVTWQDAVFWGVLALAMIANSLLEIKKGRKRSLTKSRQSTRDSIILGLKTLGIFYFICVLWSLWTCDSFASWLSMWQFFWDGTLDANQAMPRYFLLVSVIIFVAAIYFGQDSRGDESIAERNAIQQKPFKLSTISMLIVVAAAGLPQVYTKLKPDYANLIVSIKSGQLSRADEAALERGYYEELTRVDRFSSQLWEMYMNKPEFHWLDIKGAGLMRYTGDFLQEELLPGFASATPYGSIQTNKWGMRDIDYSLQPKSGTYRIALLGASSVMGWGVEQSQTFEAITEAKLNEQAKIADYDQFEILNFAVPGYFPIQQRAVLDKASPFRPNAIFYVATAREQSRAVEFLVDTVQKKISIPYVRLNAIIERSGVSADMDKATIRKRLIPYQSQIINWLYKEFVEVSNERGAKPVWVFLPSVDKGSWLVDLSETEDMARNAGFVIFNLNSVFDEHQVEDLQLEKWDKHPNKLGHELVSDALYKAISEQQDSLF